MWSDQEIARRNEHSARSVKAVLEELDRQVAIELRRRRLPTHAEVVSIVLTRVVEAVKRHPAARTAEKING